MRDNNRNKTVTLSDIAKELGVSPGTVSRALNDDPRISAETRERVWKTSRLKGYFPDSFARALRTRKSMRLGILLPTLENPVYVEKVASAQSAAWRKNYELSFLFSEWDLEQEQKCCSRILSMQADGLIVANQVEREENEHFQKLSDHGIPIVFITGVNPAVPAASSLMVNRVLGMEQAMDHLLELGHRTFGLIGYKKSGPDSYVHKLRWQGILNKLRIHNMNEDCLEVMPTADDSKKSGYEGISWRIKSGIDLPTSIIALNDEIACGTIAALSDYGVKVPEQVSVIGFDNTAIAEFIRPALTTVSQTHLDLGRRAVEILFDKIEHPQNPPQHIQLVPKLVLRESTAPPPLKPAVVNFIKQEVTF